VAWDRLKEDEQLNLMHNIRDELYMRDSLAARRRQPLHCQLPVV